MLQLRKRKLSYLRYFHLLPLLTALLTLHVAPAFCGSFDKLDSYCNSASIANSDLSVNVRYAIGALLEARKLNLSDPVQAKKYEFVQEVSEEVYAKCNCTRNLISP